MQLNFWIVLCIVIVLAVYFLFRYIKEREIYQLLFLIWVPSILLSYIPAVQRSKSFHLILAIFQIIMFILVLFFMFKKPKAAPAKENDELKTPDSDKAADDLKYVDDSMPDDSAEPETSNDSMPEEPTEPDTPADKQ